jgi:hypothetical protein
MVVQHSGRTQDAREYTPNSTTTFEPLPADPHPQHHMKRCIRVAKRKIQETLAREFPSRAILGPLDTLVDIGVPAEKEVIL